MKKNILIVDDDLQLNSFLTRFLKKHDLNATSASTAAEARLLLKELEFTLIILDLNLPDADGLEIAKEIEQSARTPIIMLTARTEVYDRILGLELGADDYLTKPFEPRELLARIKAVLRRSQMLEEPIEKTSENPTEIYFSEFVLDMVERRILKKRSRETIPLTNSEFVLLEALVEHAGMVTSRDIIMDRIYGNNINVTDRAIDAHITRLRRKIDGDETTTSIIRAVRGEGYLLATAAETV